MKSRQPQQHYIIVLTGPAGAGKTTVQNYLATEYGIPKIITHTTRPPRAHEQAGVHYYFETPASFNQLDLLESVHYAGHQYGSSREALDRVWQQNPLASIVLDTQGALTYRKRLGEQAVIIYLAVPETAELHRRMLKRGDSPAAVQARLHSAETQRDLELPAELKDVGIYLPNREWEQTTAQLQQIIEKLNNG
ncbi:guanylate kinase [Fructilactobacillus carniphilus]|uniref:Guanylate kinase n=1 Tax=Fructilactobacillus carniphilus TaxID=2940297 RepID=A0ABY5BY28_9LACO|nr:guanylate kinase [Fructilactobacillus carniphilus]USS90704.1 guanylate kinase [Fructilactobacillus carniphilus]